MSRAFVLILDSLGVGALPDAAAYGDQGAHTLDHICAAAGRPEIPRLVELGLGCVAGVASLPRPARAAAAHGRMTERSPGKDTPTGHWEMMGCVLDRRFPVYPDGFPAEIVDEWVRRAEIPGALFNKPASGTEIIERLGAEHVRTGKPILYTSADSVFQVAAHEQHFGLERLYRICEVARGLLDPHGVGRVIARPFVGEPGAYRRTYNRRDYSMKPPRRTALDRLQAAGVRVVGLGKIHDIYAGAGVSESVHTEGNRDGMRAATELARTLPRGLVFVNLVDFDMLYGHRRDALGYRRALEEFDQDLCRFERELRPGDLVVLSADHGNDPTFAQNTDHTREYVPVIAWRHGGMDGRDLGTRESFADVGATLEEFFGLAPAGPGRSFLAEMSRAA